MPAGLAPVAPFVCDEVVVVGGGCYGRWYTQQLDRAVRAGAAQLGRVIVVDRDASCRVAAERTTFGSLTLEVVTATWADFLGPWLDAIVASGASGPTRLLVPSPLMPHLLLEWLEARAQTRWPARPVHVVPLDRATGGALPPVPWQRSSPDARHYVSFAEWMCPINCIEPSTCPKTRGPRDWSMPAALAGWAPTAQGGELPLRGPIIFPCLHRTWGVGMIDAAAIRDADAALASAAADGPVRVLVGSVSHCHGALGVLHVG